MQSEGFRLQGQGHSRETLYLLHISLTPECQPNNQSCSYSENISLTCPLQWEDIQSKVTVTCLQGYNLSRRWKVTYTELALFFFID